MRNGLGDERIPAVGKSLEVSWPDGPAAGFRSTGTKEVGVQVEQAVIIGDLLSFRNIPYGNLEIIAGRERGRIAGVIDESAVIPAQNALAFAVEVRILFDRTLQHRLHVRYPGRINHLVQVVENPGDASFGNETGGKHSISNSRTYMS